MLKLAFLCSSLLFPAISMAGEVVIQDAYIRVSGKMAKAGAAFMVIENRADEHVTLIAAETEVAKKVELHTHIMEDNVAKMREIEGGIVVPANSEHALERGADHVMLMGLTGPLEDGDMVDLTLKFDGADDIMLTVPVDSSR